jgi:hypothetical protein
MVTIASHNLQKNYMPTPVDAAAADEKYTPPPPSAAARRAAAADN